MLISTSALIATIASRTCAIRRRSGPRTAATRQNSVAPVAAVSRAASTSAGMSSRTARTGVSNRPDCEQKWQSSGQPPVLIDTIPSTSTAGPHHRIRTSCASASASPTRSSGSSSTARRLRLIEWNPAFEHLPARDRQDVIFHVRSPFGSRPADRLRRVDSITPARSPRLGSARPLTGRRALVLIGMVHRALAWRSRGAGTARTRRSTVMRDPTFRAGELSLVMRRMSRVHALTGSGSAFSNVRSCRFPGGLATAPPLPRPPAPAPEDRRRRAITWVLSPRGRACRRSAPPARGRARRSWRTGG